MIEVTSTTSIENPGKLAFRQHLTQFIDLTDEEWDVFREYLHIRVLKKKEYFSEPLKICDQIGLIISGSVRYFNIVEGNEITGYFIFEKNFVTAFKSYLMQQPSLYYIQALEDTRLVTFYYHDMQALFTHPLLSHKMERFGRLLVEHYVILFEDRIKSFVLKTPEERYLELVKTGKNVLQRIPQHYIAKYIGVTPVSLSRIRRRILSGKTP